jgi:predicted dehydrogenase
MRKYRAGIIGCGNIFPMHAVSVMEQENADLVTVCDGFFLCDEL